MMTLTKHTLPKLLPAVTGPARVRPTSALVFSGDQQRRAARLWHVRNPDFVIDILTRIGVVSDDAPETRAQVIAYIEEATEIGMFSKADITQYTAACMNAGGSIATVATFRDILIQFTEDTPDVMAQIIAAAPIHYWTYLPHKVRRHDGSV